MTGIRRRAASLGRGDALQWVQRQGARLLPPAAPGNVWTGLRARPRQAVNLGAPDLHQLRGEVLATVLETIAPVVPVLLPPIPRRPWRLAVREDDAAGVRASLHSLPPHWGLRATGNEGPFTVRPLVAVGGRQLERTPDLELRIDVMARDGDAYRGTAQGTLGSVPAEAWTDVAQASLAPGRRLPGPPAPRMPIDAVYTWVNGDDPGWRARRDAALGGARAPGPGGRHPSAVDDARFADTDELRYSMRSLHRYANWVRRIYLVTDRQVPEWLRLEHPRVHVIDHHELLGGSRFNSHAIESALHRIPGIAEHYLYLNDDVFFGRIAHPGDFFPMEGAAVFYPSDLPIDPGPATADDPPIMAAAKNGRDLMLDRFEVEVRTKVRHTVHPQLRDVAEQIEAENPDAIARTRAALLRSPEDLSVASSLHHWYAHALRRSFPATPNYLYLDLADPGAPQSLDALGSLRRYDTFCLNTEERAVDPAVRAELRGFLESYFPDRAPWER